LDDLALAFIEQHVHLSELEDFVKHVDSVMFPLDVVRFPEPKASCVNCFLRETKDEIKNDDEFMSSLDVEGTIFFC